MTARPGNPGLESLRYTRAKRLCHLLEITRKDGEVLRVTDHDRRLTFEGNTFRPVIVGSLSAERREAALRSGDQEAKGVIDGTIVTTIELDADRYTGAQVRQIIVDWARPWQVLVAHRKWIRKVVRNGVTWTATLEGRTQQLQRPSAGRFGGTFAPKCPYRLGGIYCKKDISQWTQMRSQQTGVSTAADALTMTDSVESWTTDQWAGYRVIIYGGPGSGQEREILSNDSDTLTVSVPWDTPPTGSNYRIGIGPEVDLVVRSRYEFEFDAAQWLGTQEDGWYRDGTVEWVTGDNAGSVHAVSSYTEATKRVTLLIPTAFPIQLGDTAIVRVGCDGLIGTCKDKFDNVENFGGDPFAPSAQQIIEPPEAS